MKKVMLINSNMETSPYPVAPLGISLVASSLNGEYAVDVFDFAFHDTDALIARIGDFDPDYVGISLRNIDNVTMRRCRWYLRDIKEKIVDPVKRCCNAPIILGGSGFSIAPRQLYDFFGVDYGIIGEGERTLPELLSVLDRDAPVEKIPYVVTKTDFHVDLPASYGADLMLPMANIDRFIDIAPYLTRGSYPVQTKRGCSHKCIYCSYPNIEGRTYRLRPAADIVDEIEQVRRRISGITFEFVDSTFNSPLDHALDICREIIRRGLKVRLRTMGVNPGDVTEELMFLMKEAGFTQIDCTPDSASEDMIRSYRKNFDREQLIECARLIRESGMPTMWFFLIGGPGESERTILETFDFIDEHIHPEDMVHITEGIRIIPDTELYHTALTEGVIDDYTSVIEPMFYVSPGLGGDKLTRILAREVARRNNVMNSIDTAPSKELMKAAMEYRSENQVDEPMFRTLLRLQNRMP